MVKILILDRLTLFLFLFLILGVRFQVSVFIASSGQQNGQFNRKRNFGLVLLICVAYLAIE